jgi:hypothetical protein
VRRDRLDTKVTGTLTGRQSVLLSSLIVVCGLAIPMPEEETENPGEVRSQKHLL